MKTKLALVLLLGALCFGLGASGPIAPAPNAEAIWMEAQRSQLIANMYYLQWDWAQDPSHVAMDLPDNLWMEYVYWTGRYDGLMIAYKSLQN